MSPSHQTCHANSSSSVSRAPVARRLSAPMVALTSVLATAPSSTSATTSRPRSSEGR